MSGVFKSFKLTKPNIHWSPDWIKASTYYEFYTSLLITTIWNRINNGLLFCTRHTGTLYQSKNNSDWSILPSKDPETSFKPKLNSFFFLYIYRFIYYGLLLWVPSNDKSYILLPSVCHKNVNFDGMIICSVYLDIHWLEVHLMYWTFVSTLLIYSAQNGIQWQMKYTCTLTHIDKNTLT